VHNLAYKRKLRQPQLLLLGEAGVGKTTFLANLAEFLKLYYIPERKDDFSGASLDADVWVCDEFSSDSMSPRILLKVLDGQPCRLDSKYGILIEKTKNVPIILSTNDYPLFDRRQRAFDTRVLVVTFKEKNTFDSYRLAKTIDCMLKQELVKKLPLVELPVGD
jgi:GTPase SAR1 family protein